MARCAGITPWRPSRMVVAIASVLSPYSQYLSVRSGAPISGLPLPSMPWHATQRPSYSGLRGEEVVAQLVGMGQRAHVRGNVAHGVLATHAGQHLAPRRHYALAAIEHG